MLRPSYGELMDILNDKSEDMDNKITSRYTIVIAAAKRARQIVNGASCDDADVATDKAVSIAVNEIGKGKILVLPNGSPEDEFLYDSMPHDYSSLTESTHEIDFSSDDEDDEDDYNADYATRYDEESDFLGIDDASDAEDDFGGVEEEEQE